MEKERYMISDAAAMTGVESHVLRYWEDELDLTIPRNEMGHRYYTQDNIKEFQQIKELKEKGYQLKAIRTYLHSHAKTDTSYLESMAANAKSYDDFHGFPYVPSMESATHLSSGLHKDGSDPDERMERFRLLMCEIVGQAVAQNNEELSLRISQDVRESVLKEMNYLFREQEESENARYLQLDAAIRSRIARKHALFSHKDKPPKEKQKKKKRTSTPLPELKKA